MTEKLDLKGKDVNPNFSSYLTDESRLVLGKADKIFFPKNKSELISLVQYCQEKKIHLTVSGGGTGLTGGRVPLDGWIIATDQLTTLNERIEKINYFDQEQNKSYEISLDILDESNALLTVPASMTIKAIQNYVKSVDWFYPPDPTERSAFIGGAVATNASGARSFKFGATREWVYEIAIVLPEGKEISLKRNEHSIIGNNKIIQLIVDNKKISVPIPDFKPPNVKKNVAGPVIKSSSHIMDLFIGTDGIFGIINEVTLKLIRPPKDIVSIIIFCKKFDQAIKLIQISQRNREEKKFPIPLSVELLDENAISIMRRKNSIPDKTKAIIYLEQDVYSEDEMDKILDNWSMIFDKLGIEKTWVETNYAGIEKHKEFRHALPETVNHIVRTNGQPKLGTDYSVPEEKILDLFTLSFSLGKKFQDYQNEKDLINKNPGYAIWAHAGDNHVHLNFLPRNDSETQFAKSLMVDMMKKIVAMGGSISAEHGLGKKVFNGIPALYYQYSKNEIDQIWAIKSIIDPNNILNPNSLLGSKKKDYLFTN